MQSVMTHWVPALRRLNLVQGMALIMFLTTSTFFRMCAVNLAPILSHLSSSTLLVCSNLNTRCWITCFAGHLHLWTWIPYCTYLVVFKLRFIRKYFFMRNTHSFTKYSTHTGVKSNTWNTLFPYLDDTVLSLTELPTTLFSCYSSFCCDRLFRKTQYNYAALLFPVWCRNSGTGWIVALRGKWKLIRQ